MAGVRCSVFLLHMLILLTAAEWCNFDYDDDYETYCSNGCCADKCCYDFEYYSPVPLIVGSAIGGFFFIATIIALVYACLRSGNPPGRVISLGGGTRINTVTISHSAAPFYPGHGSQATDVLPPPYTMTQPPPYTPYPENMGSHIHTSVVNYDTIPPPPMYTAEPRVLSDR